MLTYDKEHTATAMLFPAVTRTADMLASKPGIWQYRCDVQVWQCILMLTMSAVVFSVNRSIGLR